MLHRRACLLLNYRVPAWLFKYVSSAHPGGDFLYLVFQRLTQHVCCGGQLTPLPGHTLLEIAEHLPLHLQQGQQSSCWIWACLSVLQQRQEASSPTSGQMPPASGLLILSCPWQSRLQGLLQGSKIRRTGCTASAMHRGAGQLLFT